MKTREIKALHEAVYSQYRILDGMPEAAALNQFKESKMYSKAQEVEQAYDAAQYENCSSGGCYALAIAAAHEFGGVEIYNSNDGSRTISFAPTRTFEFDDSSSVQVTYGGVYVID